MRVRMAVAALILIALVVLGSRLLPIYLNNLRLESYVAGVTQNAENRTQSDDTLRRAVLKEAATLGLPVTADDVHIQRNEDNLRIEVRYIVRVDFPLYKVDLHFYPGSR